MTETSKLSLRPRLAAIALLLGVFVAGAVTGIQLYRWGERNSMALPPPPRMPPRMRLHTLGLSTEQQRKIDAIMNKHHPDIEAVLREGFPRLRAIHDRIDAEIRPILNEEQRIKFDSMKLQAPGRHLDGPPVDRHRPPHDMLPPPELDSSSSATDAPP